MAKSWKDATADRYEAIERNNRIGNDDYTVADLISIYGSRGDLAAAYAAERGVQRASALRAISRLEAYESGKRGGNVRSAAKIRDTLTQLGQDKLPAGGGEGSGMGGGDVTIDGKIGISGSGIDYEDERDIDLSMDEEDLDALAIAAWEEGEEAANQIFADAYEFNATFYLVDADVNIN